MKRNGMTRKGMTLVEVLVAIFVMALGMLALLTLFPLGALRMAAAIQDGRTAVCAANANALATIKNIRQDPAVTGFDVALFGGPVDDNGPSNPILVDPIGYARANGISKDWVRGRQGLIRRTTTSFSLGAIDPSFLFMEDYEFEAVGTGQRMAGELSNPDLRDYTYSWAYMLQRPRTIDASVVDMSVMVFRRRPTTLKAEGVETVLSGETVYQSAGVLQQKFDLSRGVVTIDHRGMEPPSVRVGEWILDATVGVRNGKRIPHAYFYRVVGITEIDDNTTELEVQSPFRGFGPGFTQAADGSFLGTVVIFDGLVEVFERGTGWK